VRHEHKISDYETKIYKITISAVLLDRCETWSVDPMEEQRLKVSEIRIPKRMDGENYITRSSIICTRHKILIIFGKGHKLRAMR
jgi:hypothetical protein